MTCFIFLLLTQSPLSNGVWSLCVPVVTSAGHFSSTLIKIIILLRSSQSKSPFLFILLYTSPPLISITFFVIFFADSEYFIRYFWKKIGSLVTFFTEIIVFMCYCLVGLCFFLIFYDVIYCRIVWNQEFGVFVLESGILEGKNGSLLGFLLKYVVFMCYWFVGLCIFLIFCDVICCRIVWIKDWCSGFGIRYSWKVLILDLYWNL